MTKLVCCLLFLIGLINGFNDINWNGYQSGLQLPTNMNGIISGYNINTNDIIIIGGVKYYSDSNNIDISSEHNSDILIMNLEYSFIFKNVLYDHSELNELHEWNIISNKGLYPDLYIYNETMYCITQCYIQINNQLWFVPQTGYIINNENYNVKRYLFIFDMDTLAYKSIHDYNSTLPYQYEQTCVTGNNEFIYVIGGTYYYYIGSQRLIDYVRNVQRYNILNDTWDMISPLHYGRSDCGCTMTSNNDKIYVFGGIGGEFVHNSSEVYNISTDKWYVLPTGLDDYRQHPRAFLLENENQILLIGGHNGIGVDTIEEFDLDTETFIEKNNSNIKRGVVSFGYTKIDNIRDSNHSGVVLFGGSYEYRHETNWVQFITQYIPENITTANEFTSFSSHSSLIESIGNMSGNIIWYSSDNNNVYIFGGWINDEINDKVYVINIYDTYLLEDNILDISFNDRNNISFYNWYANVSDSGDHISCYGQCTFEMNGELIIPRAYNPQNEIYYNEYFTFNIENGLNAYDITFDNEYIGSCWLYVNDSIHVIGGSNNDIYWHRILDKNWNIVSEHILAVPRKFAACNIDNIYFIIDLIIDETTKNIYIVIVTRIPNNISRHISNGFN